MGLQLNALCRSVGFNATSERTDVESVFVSVCVLIRGIMFGR